MRRRLVIRRPFPLLLGIAAVAALAIPGCDGGTGPDGSMARIRLVPEAVELAGVREGTVTISNTGGRAVGPVGLHATPLVAPGGGGVPDGTVEILPAEIATLGAGASAEVTVRLLLPSLLEPGRYTSSVRIESELDPIVLPVSYQVPSVAAGQVATLEIVQAPAAATQGTVADFEIEARDPEGRILESAPVTWTTTPAGGGHGVRNSFVPYEAGTLTVRVTAGTGSDAVQLDVAPREVGGSMTALATSPTPGRQTSDLWVHGDAAYAGTWAPFGETVQPGNALFVWDVSDRADPILVDSVLVDARVVNDIKISEDGTLGILTQEHATDGLDGITLLDLDDPHHPRIITRYTQGLTNGVHNLWIDGDYAYLAVDHDGGLKILDISNPAVPEEVASYFGGEGKFGRVPVHDVYVRDGLAFVSHWDAGLVILDVGNGIAGGSPESPVEISDILLGGETHNAWYWPEGRYVFVGEEAWDPDGKMRVVDLTDPARPAVVATYRVEGESPHNFWLDENREILYMAWYSKGVRALDVSGRLLGELDRQGREIAVLTYGDGTVECVRDPGPTCAWAPQLHDGTLFVSDMRHGLVVATPVE